VTGVAERRRPTAVDLSTVADAPPWQARERPTWGLEEGDAIAPGRTVLRRLGGGRLYEVFLVWDDHRLAVLVAKVLRPDRADQADHLVREAAILGRLGHPVIVRGFDARPEPPLAHLLLEHLEGPTLRELIEDHGPLALEQALPLGLHLASALHYLAGEGLVHLDVKPDNVVMGAPPRLIDFSVARSVAEAERLRRPVGTHAYMAPEQREPDSHPVGPPADVYGLAATLHHALAGARAPEPLPRRVPAALAGLLRAAMAEEPADRPAAAELAAALEPLVAALPRRRGWRR
jgi:eukaryotic-like serine/threonine-protein kinase